ncbi:MAG: hypothetical protein K8W52_22785 [Deltaproteobacteria bacterium]|nr:hypothetical protein [Deltaproteobacteria bacterium]
MTDPTRDRLPGANARSLVFRFGLAPATAVVTTTYVMKQGLPVLDVTHEDDEQGGALWQFHCGNGDYEPAVLMLVTLAQVLALDETVAELADLPRGWRGTRAERGAPWQRGIAP